MIVIYGYLERESEKVFKFHMNSSSFFFFFFILKALRLKKRWRMWEGGGGESRGCLSEELWYLQVILK